MVPTREQAREWDDRDPLADYRRKFVTPRDEGLVAYLDGNSLGRPPESVRERLADLVTRQWGSGLIRSWDDEWLDWPRRIGDRIGSAALGAEQGQVIVADSTTVCLYKAIRAAAAMRPGRAEIVTDVHNFPTDRYVVEGIAGELGMTVRWLQSDPVEGVTSADLAAACGERTAVVTLSHVDYRSAAIADLAALTGVAHAAGALTVWDLCHSVGAIPVHLDAGGADFAVGCTYKFLCAGPGAPAFLYVRAGHQPAFRQPIQGWLGRDEPFEMAPGYVPAAGIERALSGTPPIVALAGVDEGTALVERAGIGSIRAKGVALGELAVALTDAWLAGSGFRVASPRDPARRGGHLTISRADARALSGKLIDLGVLVDFRTPDGIRLGLSPLSTGYEELWCAMDVLRSVAG